MIGRTNISGGGGAGLNFKIVGNPKPATAAANTIWIDTDDITGWEFSTTEPENPVPGMVWVSTGTSSPVAFNALKKNTIVVNPISAKQCVGGTWVEVASEIYQNGWLEWLTYLYKYGDECIDVTGGWTTSKASNGTVTKNEDHVYFSYTGSNNIQSYLRTTNKISFPFKSYKTLKARLDITSHFSATNGSSMGLTTSTQAGRDDFAFSTAFTDKGNGIVVSLDISGASGDFYVSFYSGMKTSKLYEVWFE